MSEFVIPIPIPQTLALSYSPLADRDIWRCYFALDAHLAELVRKTSEPLLGQIRLAWWRDRLREPSGSWLKGNPLLAQIAEEWGQHASDLAPLVDGWEHLLAESPIEISDIEGFADGRARAFGALAALLHASGQPEVVRGAAMIWALADLASHSADDKERRRVQRAALKITSDQRSLAPRLRPLAILAGLGKRSLANGCTPLFSGRRAALATMRLGMFGR